jgi:hypothetical protein
MLRSKDIERQRMRKCVLDNLMVGEGYTLAGTDSRIAC